MVTAVPHNVHTGGRGYSSQLMHMHQKLPNGKYEATEIDKSKYLSIRMK